jgi:hypothetical protein
MLSRRRTLEPEEKKLPQTATVPMDISRRILYIATGATVSSGTCCSARLKSLSKLKKADLYGPLTFDPCQRPDNIILPFFYI